MSKKEVLFLVKIEHIYDVFLKNENKYFCISKLKEELENKLNVKIHYSFCLWFKLILPKLEDMAKSDNGYIDKIVNKNSKKHFSYALKYNNKITFKCTHCGKVKPIDEFYKNSSCKTGYKRACKDCCNKYARENPRVKCFKCNRLRLKDCFRKLEKEVRPTKGCPVRYEYKYCIECEEKNRPEKVKKENMLWSKIKNILSKRIKITFE